MAWNLFIRSNIEISSACARALFEADQRNCLWNSPEGVTTPYYSSFKDGFAHKGEKKYLKFPRHPVLGHTEWSDMLGGAHSANFALGLLMKHRAKGIAEIYNTRNEGDINIYEFDGKGGARRIEKSRQGDVVEVRTYSNPRFDEKRTVAPDWVWDERCESDERAVNASFPCRHFGH